MLRAFKAELVKMFRSWLFLTCLVLLAGFALVMLLGYDALFARMVGRQAQLQTGYMYSYIALSVIFYPFYSFMGIAIAGASISQEIRGGTLRYALISPVSRAGFVVAKFGSIIVSITVLQVAYWALVVGAGLMIYGPGRIATVPTVPSVDGTAARVATILTEDEALRRFIMFVPLVVVACLVVASLAFFVSTLSGNPVVAVTIPMGIFLMAWILQFSQLLQGVAFKKFLFTRELYYWDWVFAAEPKWSAVLAGLQFNGAWIALFFVAALVSFSLRDVKS